MRLDSISEGTEFTLQTWNKHLLNLAARSPHTPRTDNEEEERKGYEYYKKGYRLLKKAEQYHIANFGGKRWPELEKALLGVAGGGWGDNPLMLGYLNNISEEWPEGHKALVDGASDHYGANEPTVQYLLKKNVEAPSLTAYYHNRLAPKQIRRHLKDRINQMQRDLQVELAKPKPKQPDAPVDPMGLDDQDEFQKRGWSLTAKQLQNRINIANQTLLLPDDELTALVLDKRPKTTASREALGLPWAPPSMRSYVDKYGRQVFNK